MASTVASTAQKAILARVDQLTREQIAPRAAEHDAAGANPIDSWRVLGRDGFLASCKDFPAERAFRDVRTSTLMPPTVDRMLEGIGKHTLGIDGGMFRVAGQ